jgi:signal transduction histidine kinase
MNQRFAKWSYVAVGALRPVFYLAGIAALSVIALLAWDLRASRQEVRQAAAEMKADVHGMVQNANAILLQAGLAADEARRASEEQRAFANVFDKELLAGAQNTNAAILDIRGLVASVQGDLRTNSNDLHDVSGATVAALNELPPLLRSAQGTTDSANRLISDQDIQRTIKNLADSSQHIAGTTDNVEQMSKIVEKKVEQMTKPASLGKALLNWLLNTAYKVKAFF